MMAKVNRLKTLPHAAGSHAKASVIDLGSNSLKLVNYNVDSNSYKPYHQESTSIKLAEGLVDGILLDRYTAKAIETLKFFRNIIDFEQIDYTIAVATSTVRDATNRDTFLEDIRRETGFSFKILSEREEALYSYTGAICSLSLPSTVFFDIGGGSLEFVSSDNFEIQNILSLPLGALRLTQQFSTGGSYSRKEISSMRSHIADCLPSKESLGLSSSDPVLVGAGGTLRAIAKYDQHRTGYPLTKLHNYSISAESIESICWDLLLKTPQEMAMIESIGNRRACIIQAGLVAVSEIVEKLGFSSLVVSAQALREGTLSLSLQYPEDFAAHKIDRVHVQDLVHLSCQPNIISRYIAELTETLFSMKLVTDKERILLAEAIIQIDKLSSFRDADSVLYSILDDDSILSHREQLMVALSLIYSKKKKLNSLISKFEDILELEDKKTIRRISTVITLCDIFHRTRTTVRPRYEGTDLLSLDICASKTFPEVLLRRACSKMSSTLGINIKPVIHRSVGPD